MGCLPECAPDIQELVLENCESGRMKGGIRALAFLKCDASFDEVSGESIADVAVWQALMASSDLFITASIIGSKPKGTATSLRTKSCSPEEVTARTQVLNFRDYNADLTNLTHYDFWISIQQNFPNLKLLYITCEGYVYGPFDNGTWTLDIDDVRDETSEQPVNMDGSISINAFNLVKPVFVPGLLNALPYS